jgi:hypothetical protein
MAAALHNKEPANKLSGSEHNVGWHAEHLLQHCAQVDAGVGGLVDMAAATVLA